MTTKPDKIAADVLAMTRSVGTPGFGAAEGGEADATGGPAVEPGDASAEVLALVRKTGLASFSSADDGDDKED